MLCADYTVWLSMSLCGSLSHYAAQEGVRELKREIARLVHLIADERVNLENAEARCVPLCCRSLDDVALHLH